MRRRSKEGSGQIITKPTEERESAEISFGGQVSEDERRSTLRMATICLVSHARFPRDSRGNPISFQPGSEERLRWSPQAASEEKGQQEYPEDRDNDILELRDVIEVRL